MTISSIVSPPSDAIYPCYKPTDLTFVRGEGMYLYDDAGTPHLDFIAGIGVHVLGHCHPRLVKALTDQANSLWHVGNHYRIAQQERLARRLVEATFADRVFFTNSGSEAVECAIKTARRYFFNKGEVDRFRIITFEGAFHGRTLGAIAAGGRAEHIAGFGPVLEGFDQVPFGDVDAARDAITPATAAILVEPIQGEGGVREWPLGQLHALAKLARDHDLLLICDEVQCGNGRTGSFFAFDQARITPDIVATAKGIGAGFPLGACLATERVASAMVFGTHGSTFGGNPLATAVGNSVLDVLLDDEFRASVDAVGLYLGDRLEELAERCSDVVIATTGRGLMRGLVLSEELTVGDVRRAMCVSHGVLVGTAARNTVRLLPPLIAQRDHIDTALTALESVLSASHRSVGPTRYAASTAPKYVLDAATPSN